MKKIEKWGQTTLNPQHPICSTGNPADVITSEKFLTISIAAYNVEEYIAQALDSCLIDEMDALDVIIVDDGSSDGTADLAASYVARFPQTFRLISKVNGGYGSTVNTSLGLAKGKYFKLLDGDDWFDKHCLNFMVSALRVNDCDLVITPFNEVRAKTTRTVDQSAASAEGCVPFEPGLVPRELSMHSVAFRTELLRDIGLALPEKRLYTDVLFAVAPLARVDTAFVSHRPLYQYRLDRAGQSVSLESELMHCGDRADLICDLVQIYDNASIDTIEKHIVGYWLSGVSGHYLKLLYSRKPSSKHRAEIADMVRLLQSNPDIWKVCRDQSRWFRLLSGAGDVAYVMMSRILSARFKWKGGT